LLRQAAETRCLRCVFKAFKSLKARRPRSGPSDARPWLRPASGFLAPEAARQAASGKADDDAHRPRWITLRSCKARRGRQRGGARGEMQSLSTKNFHDLPLEDLLLMEPLGSVRGDASGLDDFAPLLGFIRDEFAEIRGGSGSF